MPLSFAHRVYLRSVVLISPGLRDDVRSVPGQLPGEDTARGPRVAPRAIPAVVVGFG